MARSLQLSLGEVTTMQDLILDRRAADSVNAVNTMVVSLTPSVALATRMLNQSFNEGMAASNAVFAQQQTWIQGQTSLAATVAQLFASK